MRTLFLFPRKCTTCSSEGICDNAVSHVAISPEDVLNSLFILCGASIHPSFAIVMIETITFMLD